MQVVKELPLLSETPMLKREVPLILLLLVITALTFAILMYVL
jgi:hypothetical protein